MGPEAPLFLKIVTPNLTASNIGLRPILSAVIPGCARYCPASNTGLRPVLSAGILGLRPNIVR